MNMGTLGMLEPNPPGQNQTFVQKNLVAADNSMNAIGMGDLTVINQSEVYAELKDHNNLLKTAPSADQPEKSTIVAALKKKTKSCGLLVWRLFSVESDKNSY